MSTRGALTLVGNEAVRTMYNHADSYPSGLGADALMWLRAVLAHEEVGEEVARQTIARLESVPDREPTADDAALLAEFHDPDVSTGKDWYSLLRRTQGDISATLRAGYYEPAEDFPLDSLFCEWAYVVDFDTRVFEVYEGVQKTPPTAGRWVGQTGFEDSAGYYPVQRVASYSFDDLPVTLASFEADGMKAVTASEAAAAIGAGTGAPEGWTVIES